MIYSSLAAGFVQNGTDVSTASLKTVVSETENIHNKGTQEKTRKFEVLNQGSLSVQTFFFFFLIRSVGDLFLHRYKSTLPSTPHAIPQQTYYHYSSRSGKGRQRAPEHLHLPVLHAAMHRQLT